MSAVVVRGSKFRVRRRSFVVMLCRGKGWVLDLQPNAVNNHAFDENFTQTNKTPLQPFNSSSSLKRRLSPTSSPSKKRKALSEVTGNNTSPRQRYSTKTHDSNPESLQSGRKAPGKVFTAGKRGILDGRPVLRDIYNESM